MIAALFGIGVLTGGDDAEGPEPKPEPAVDVARVASRLERVRGLRFEELPPVRHVTSAEAREEGLAALDEDYPPRRRRADEQLLVLLGLLPRGSDIRELAGEIFGEEVAGYYDERRQRMTVVGEAGDGADEITLAHELTHALEDQHFGLDPGEGAFDDEQTAHTALVEGTATVAMLDYSARFLAGGRVPRRRLLAQLDLVDLLESESGLPPYLQRSLVFPYSAGARFVDAIGTWGPANRALRGRGPVSTEQILHPAKYSAREKPLRVPPPRSPGRGWRRAAKGTIGEFDTGELIRSSDSALRADRAAAGWGGGSYALFRKEGKSIVSLAWRWDSPRDAAEFAAALPRYIERTLDGRPARVDVGATVRLTIGPAE
jgi:hypothetical protein